jgi:hypothetical protein
MTKTYIVTGVLRNGKRFKSMIYKEPMWALSINLWHGSVWESIDGRRRLLKHVDN